MFPHHEIVKGVKERQSGYAIVFRSDVFIDSEVLRVLLSFPFRLEIIKVHVPFGPLDQQVL